MNRYLSSVIVGLLVISNVDAAESFTNVTAAQLREVQAKAFKEMAAAVATHQPAAAESYAKVLYLASAVEMIHPMLQLERGIEPQVENAPKILQTYIRLLWEAEGPGIKQKMLSGGEGPVVSEAFVNAIDAFVRGTMTAADEAALDAQHLPPNKPAKSKFRD